MEELRKVKQSKHLTLKELTDSAKFIASYLEDEEVYSYRIKKVWKEDGFVKFKIVELLTDGESISGTYVLEVLNLSYIFCEGKIVSTCVM